MHRAIPDSSKELTCGIFSDFRPVSRLLDGGHRRRVLLTASAAVNGGSKTVRMALNPAGLAIGTASLTHEFAQSVAPFAGKMEYSFLAEDASGNTTSVARHAALGGVQTSSLAGYFQ